MLQALISLYYTCDNGKLCLHAAWGYSGHSEANPAQPAFQAINLEPEENEDEQIDTTKELHVSCLMLRFTPPSETR